MPVPRLLKSLLAGAAMLAAPLPAFAQAGDEGGWHVATHVTPIGSGDRVHGPATAAVSVIVWLDPECPYCKLLGTTPETVVDGAGGRVNLAVRLYPLPFHAPNAMVASLAALCVGDQGGDVAYYRFLDTWLAMTGGNGKGLPSAAGSAGDPVAALAGTSGAGDRSALAACTAAPSTAERLGEEMRSAQRAGLSGTPAIAVRNNASGRTIMINGAIEADDLQAAITYMAQQ
jgi:protein-disulfide isomerase